MVEMRMRRRIHIEAYMRRSQTLLFINRDGVRTNTNMPKDMCASFSLPESAGTSSFELP